jgi:hypothetical protein
VELKIKIGDSTRIYDSDRISGATDNGMSIEAHGIGTPVIIRVKVHVEYGLE